MLHFVKLFLVFAPWIHLVPAPTLVGKHKPLFHDPTQIPNQVSSTTLYHGHTPVYHPKPWPLPPLSIYNPRPVEQYKPYDKPAPPFLPAKLLPLHPRPPYSYLPVKPAPIYPPVEEDPKPYSYEYGVHDDYSGVHYNAGQVADGSGNVEGSYTVALPDGRTQHVTYHVDPYSGFVANVHYEGEAHYDQAPPYHDPAPPSDYHG